MKSDSLKSWLCVSFVFGTALFSIGAPGAIHEGTQSMAGQIIQSPLFSPPLSWVGEQPPSESESQALWSILSNVTDQPVYEQLQQFISSHPQSGWTPSLRAHVARMHREKGRYTLALREWEGAWLVTKSFTNSAGRSVAEFTLAHWSQLLASLGRTEKLAKLFEETAAWKWQNTECFGTFAQSREGYNTMLDYPGVSYRCGTFALTHVARMLGSTSTGIADLIDVASPSNGFSMAKLVELSEFNHLGLVAVQRPAGTEIVIPSVVHWRQNHYAAILGKKGPLYWVADPTFGYPQWMREDYVNEEASGAFLVPAGRVPSEWKALTQIDTDRLYGKGQPSTIHDWADEGCDKSPGGAGAPASNTGSAGGNKAVCVPCQSVNGMPVWWITEPYVNLFVADESLSYLQSDGSEWSIRWSYKQRDAFSLAGFSSANVPPLQRGSGMTNASWTHNFHSSIRFRDPYWDAAPGPCPGAGPTYADWEAIVYLPGGGVRRYSDTTILTNDVSVTENRSQARLEIVYGTTPPKFRMVYPDGSLDLYSTSSGGGCSPGSQAQAFLTARVDAQGRTNSIVYDPSPPSGAQRINEIVDWEGRTNRFFYTNSSFPALPTQISDAFGHNAFFGYDGTGRLTTLVDAIGLTNSIGYIADGQGWINSITTPYGTVTFSHYDASTTQNSTNQGNAGGHDRVNRYILVTDFRDSTRELYMYRYETAYQTNSYATADVPAVFGNTFDNGSASSSSPVGALRFRNSFYWGKKQMQLVTQWWNPDPLIFTATDYLYARMRHWHDANPFLLSAPNSTLISGQISIERLPSLDGVNEGHKTWFDYAGKSAGSNHRIGANAQIGTIARVLPDGTTQATTYDYLNGGQYTPYVRSRTATFTYLGTLTNRIDTYQYAANGIDLTNHIFPDGTSEKFAWNSAHQPTSFTDAAGNTTTFGYNSSRPASINQPNNVQRVFTYSNDTVAVTHPSYRMMSSFTDSPAGRTIYFPEWTNGLPKRLVGDHSLNITNTWDSFNRLTSQRYSDGTFISNRYSRLDLFATKDRLDNWTYLAHDAMQRLTTVTNANTNVTQYGYCGCGALESIKDALTNETLIFYDTQLRPWFVGLPDGTAIQYGYDALGRRTSITNGTAIWTVTYNNQNLVAAISNSFGQVQSILYDERDRPVRITDAAGVTVTNTFDGISRPLTRAWPDNGVERFVYNTNGLIRHTNQLGAGTRYAYDSSGRLSALTNASGEVTRFTYDVWSDLKELIDAKNQTNKWSYDIFGRATNKVDATGQTVFGFAYDANDRLTNRWTPAKSGINTRFTYDPMGNLKSVVYPSSSTAFEYDPLNRVKQMTDAAGTSAFTYTKNGQLASEDGPWTGDTLTNIYSQLLRTSSTLGTTWTNIYGYDAARRLTNITSGAGNFGYQFAGGSHLRTKLTLPNSASINDAYDHVGQLTNTTLLNSSAAILNAHSYNYDAWGQRTQMKVGGTSSTSPAKWDYAYDPIGQLKTALPYDANNALITAQRLGYAYDGAGNLNSRTNDLAVRNFLTDKLNQLTNLAFASPLTVSGVTTTNATNVTVNGIAATLNADGTYTATVPTGNGTNSLTAIGYERYGRRATNIVSVASSALQYDANGNLIFDGKKGFGYDDENQLLAITATNAWKSEFAYDGFGRRRVRKEYTWTNSTWSLTNEVRYVYDGMLVVQERDSGNNLKVSYTRGVDLSGGIRDAGGIGGLLARTDANGHAYYHSDGNGNVTALTDSQQNIAARYAYDPFGNFLSAAGPLALVNEMQFSSMPKHGQSGLNLYAFRTYSPSLQRFTQADPIGMAGGINLHRFLENDPINFIDPYGLDPHEGMVPVQYPGGRIIWVPKKGGKIDFNLNYPSSTGRDLAEASVKAYGEFAVGQAAGALAGHAISQFSQISKNCPPVLKGTEAARAALGKGPNVNPGAPLTQEMIAALKENLKAAENSLALAQQGKNVAGNVASEAAVARQAATAKRRIDEINRALQAGNQAPKN